MTNYVTLEEEYKHKFFQVPKVFFTNDKYKKMSNNAKVAWSLLRDRSSLSRKNKWFDLINGKQVVYFIFTNEELKELLNIGSNTTLSNVKKELENANLIETHRMGVNKPNKMYLKYPDVTKEDIYAIDEFEEYEYEEYERENNAQSQEGQGRTESGRPKSVHQDVQKVYTSNTDSSNTDLKDLDTRDTEDTSLAYLKNKINSISEKEKEQLKNQYMERGFYENNEVIPVELSNMLSVFSNNTSEAKKYYDIILKAKKNVEKELEVFIWLEHEPELLHEIINSFSRAIRKIEKERNIENINGYIYSTIYDLLSKEISSRQRIV